jgi:hypothetical protein
MKNTGTDNDKTIQEEVECEEPEGCTDSRTDKLRKILTYYERMTSTLSLSLRRQI